MKRYFEHRHVVGLEETNLVGNVYFSHFLRWQGHCREMFLREHAPGILAELASGLKIFTLACSCEYLAELSAFDEISIRLSLEELTQTQVAFAFDYVRLAGQAGSAMEPGTAGELAARGRQRVVCMRVTDGQPRPARVPEPLRRALAPFSPAAVP